MIYVSCISHTSGMIDMTDMVDMIDMIDMIDMTTGSSSHVTRRSTPISNMDTF